VRTFKEFLSENLSVRDALKILGLKSIKFTTDELRNAFHREAKKNHPDLGGQIDKMKLVNVAHQVLRPFAE
jgi:DnaJ-class molecular chaperone